MNTIIEINGERHRLFKTLKAMNPCAKCSLRSLCIGRYGKTSRKIYAVCCTTCCGFRKIKEKNND